jgi:hypothetical protein
MGICIEYIPDGHAYYISVFRNNASATVFKIESQNFVYLYQFWPALFILGTSEVLYHFKLTYKGWL